MGMRERRAALAAARAALTEIGSVRWEEPGVELGPLLREIDDMGGSWTPRGWWWWTRR